METSAALSLDDTPQKYFLLPRKNFLDNETIFFLGNLFLGTRIFSGSTKKSLVAKKK